MRILVLSVAPPWPVMGGEKLRIWSFAKQFARLGEVDLFTLGHLPPGETIFRNVYSFPVSVATKMGRAGWLILLRRSLALRHWSQEAFEWVQANHSEYDLLYCAYIHCAQYVPPDRMKGVIVDFIDAISLHYLEARKWVRGARRIAYCLDYSPTLRYEISTLQRFEHALISSPVDKAYLLERTPYAEGLTVIPTPVRVEALKYPTDTPKSEPWIVFLGKMDYFPNVDAVLWFAQEVLPLIRKKWRGQHRFVVVGANPVPQVARLSEDPSIVVTGTVPDPLPLVASASVVVAPMRVASGIQTKVLEAMAIGKPVVVTGLALRGIPEAQSWKHCIVANEADEMANAVVRVLSDASLAQHLSENARSLIVRHYSPAAVGKKLLEVVARSVGRADLNKSLLEEVTAFGGFAARVSRDESEQGPS